MFPRDSTAGWLEQLDAEMARRIIELFHHEATPEEGAWTSLRTDLEDAMVQLADRICVVGSNREVRARLGKVAFRELPFQKLTPAVEALLARREAGAPWTGLAPELNVVRGVADACDRAVDEVIGQLEKTGVSTALVYDIERLRAQVLRLELLLEAWSTPVLDPERKLAILADLVRQNHARRSVRELCRQNLHLLTRRIVERNAETGEHYVARNGRGIRRHAAERRRRRRDPGRDDVFEAAAGQARARRVFQGRFLRIELRGEFCGGAVVRFLRGHQTTRDHGPGAGATDE